MPLRNACIHASAPESPDGMDDSGLVGIPLWWLELATPGPSQGPQDDTLIGPSGDRAYGGERNTCLVRANSNSCRVIHCACRSVACAYQRAMCAYQVFLCAYQAAISAHGHFICAYEDSICAYEGAACAYRASIRAHEPLVCAYEHLVCAYERSVCAHETGQWPLALQNRRSPATLRRSAALPA
jgi:hypothetical protein